MRMLKVVAAGAMALAALAWAAPADAATYRYWSYWVGDSGAWSFSNVGPAFRIPADGAVEGWRFSEAGVSGDTPPTFAPSFDEVCGTTEAPADGKRVAVIVDPGSAADAPDGEQTPGAWALCVTADADATGYAVLRAAAGVRVDRGLICGINGYPGSECGAVVRDPQPSPAPTRSPKPKPKPAPATTSATPAATLSPSASATDSAPAQKEGRKAASPTATSSSSGAAAVADAPTPSAAPTPSLSLLATPVAPPSGGDGSGSALLTVIAIAGVAALGGGALVMSRRRRS